MKADSRKIRTHSGNGPKIVQYQRIQTAKTYSEAEDYWKSVNPPITIRSFKTHDIIKNVRLTNYMIMCNQKNHI